MLMEMSFFKKSEKSRESQGWRSKQGQKNTGEAVSAPVGNKGKTVKDLERMRGVV